MPLINCPDCNQEVSDQATACPKCAFPISSLTSQGKFALHSIQWESEEENYISVKCPKCGKISNVNKSNVVYSNATTTSIDYTVNGQGTCSCGLVFDTIVKPLEMPESSETISVSQRNSFYANSNATKTKFKLKWWGWLIILFIVLNIMNTCVSSTPPPPSKPAQSTNAPASSSNNSPSVSVNKYSNSQIKSAKSVMENVRNLANVFEDGPMLVVEFNEYLFPYDVNKRLQFVRAVADADAVLQGEARSIFFYNPGNKKFAKADKYKGVRLED